MWIFGLWTIFWKTIYFLFKYLIAYNLINVGYFIPLLKFIEEFKYTSKIERLKMVSLLIFVWSLVTGYIILLKFIGGYYFTTYLIYTAAFFVLIFSYIVYMEGLPSCIKRAY